MSTPPKGYPSQQKEDRFKAQSGSVEAIRENQFGLTVLSHIFVYKLGSDAAEASSTTAQIQATAHAAHRGDVVRFTSGAQSGKEVKVDSITANTIVLGETLSSTPAPGDTFDILRHRYPQVDASGIAIASSGPIQYLLNGVPTAVAKDTITPANTRPFPVELQATTGPINITAGDLNVSLRDRGADPSSIRIGDGTNLLGISASNEAKITAIQLPASLGQHAMAGSLSVAIASDQGALPVSQSGTWNITNISGTISLPTGAATEATLAALSTKFNSLGQKTSAASAPVVLSSDQPAIPVSQSGAWNITNISGTVSLPTGASTETTLAALSAKFNSQGQKTMAASAPVVIASDQSAIPASQSGTWNITNISGTISLPTGAATDATLAALSAKFNSLGQKTMAASAPVVLASDQAAIPVSQSGVWNITNISGAVSLPTGASTETTLAAASAKLPATLGQKAMSASLAVVVASDQSSIPVNEPGLSVVTTIRNDYTSTNVTSGAWVQLVASLASKANMIEIFDSSGQTLEIGTGSAGSETRLILVTPGGNGQVPVAIAAATRISIRAVSATANAGELDINLYS